MSEEPGTHPEPRPMRLSLPIDPGRDHILGPPTARLTLLEYGHYECDDCGRAYPLLKALQAQFAGDLRFVFRHFPLFNVHSHASMAAQAAEAAGAQGKFWPMHDLLYQHQKNLEIPDFAHHALKAGLEVYKFESALQSGIHIKRIEADYASGLASGVRGTPTLFINDNRYAGPVELAALSEALRAAL